MLVELINETISPGETVESDWFHIPDNFTSHSMFTVISGNTTMITATLLSAPTKSHTCDPDDETVFSNATSGKRRDIVALDPAEYGIVKFTNSGLGDAVVRSWFCMKR